MEIDKLYSNELKLLLKIMSEDLVNDNPTYLITIDYLTLAILESRNCAAYRILDECVLSDNISTLRDFYANRIHNECLKNNITIINPNKKVEYESKLLQILTNANIQRSEIEDNYITSEHVLLSILCDDNIVKDAFGKIGVDYKMFKNKVIQNREDKVNEEETSYFGDEKKKKKELVPSLSSNNTNITKPNKKGKSNNIDTYTINLNRLAEQNKIDNLIGREDEIKKIIKVFSRRNKNNIVLVGESGVGKTALVTGLVNKIVSGDISTNLSNKEILQVDLTAMISGTQYRGVFEERMKGLLSDIKSLNKYILFFDDIHTVLMERNNSDIINMLNNILSDNDIQVITTTTFKDYKNTIENNSILSRKLQKIIVEPTSIDDSINILQQNKHYYEDFHKVIYTDEAIKTSVELASRYITERCLPDSAFDLIDEIGAQTKLNKQTSPELILLKNKINRILTNKNEALNKDDYQRADFYLHEEKMLNIELKEKQKQDILKEKETIHVINEYDIYQIVSNITNIPINKINKNELQELSNINNLLKKEIYGQDEAINKICQTIKRNKIGLKTNIKKPPTFLFLGTSGVGKTFLAKQLAKEVYGDDKYLVRLDMSEYVDETAANKLIGSNAGYVGYEDGSYLLETIKNKKYCVLLLDEIEKAHQKIYNLLLPLLDEGHLTDNKGTKVDFSNTIIIMTSNVGTKNASLFGKSIGFNITEEDTNKNKEDIIKKEIKKHFPPEFLTRINSVVYFNQLGSDVIKNIIKNNLSKLTEIIKEKYNFVLSYNNDIVEYINTKINKEQGARMVNNIIEEEIENNVIDIVIDEYDEDTKEEKIIKISLNKKDNNLRIKLK